MKTGINNRAERNFILNNQSTTTMKPTNEQIKQIIDNQFDCKCYIGQQSWGLVNLDCVKHRHAEELKNLILAGVKLAEEIRISTSEDNHHYTQPEL
jgi:hypothetical protein